MNDNDVVLAEQWVVGMYVSPRTPPSRLADDVARLDDMFDALVEILSDRMSPARFDLSK